MMQAGRRRHTVRAMLCNSQLLHASGRVVISGNRFAAIEPSSSGAQRSDAEPDREQYLLVSNENSMAC